jgi:hypothetical protein
MRRIAGDRSLHFAVERVPDADSWDAQERHALAGLDARHPTVELGDSALELCQLCARALLEAFLPGTAELARAHTKDEVQIDLGGLPRAQDRLRVPGRMRKVERTHVNLDAEDSRLAQAEPVQRQRPAAPLNMLGEGDPVAVGGGRCRNEARRHGESRYGSSER